MSSCIGDVMKQILIAVDSEVLRQALSESLEGQFELLTACDGSEALILMQQWRPEVLVIDLSLRELDGICVLHNAFALGLRPKVIVLTAYISDYVRNALSNIDISHMMCLPCQLQTLVARILQVANESELPAADPLEDVLAMLGFRLNLGSTQILREAIRQYSCDPGMPLTTRLYPSVAQAIGGTAAQVERGIRCAIESAWKHRNDSLWRVYFPPDRRGQIPKPTNAAFIARIARCLPEKNREAYSSQKIV